MPKITRGEYNEDFYKRFINWYALIENSFGGYMEAYIRGLRYFELTEKGECDGFLDWKESVLNMVRYIRRYDKESSEWLEIDLFGIRRASSYSPLLAVVQQIIFARKPKRKLVFERIFTYKAPWRGPSATDRRTLFLPEELSDAHRRFIDTLVSQVEKYDALGKPIPKLGRILYR